MTSNKSGLKRKLKVSTVDIQIKRLGLKVFHSKVFSSDTSVLIKKFFCVIIYDQPPLPLSLTALMITRGIYFLENYFPILLKKGFRFELKGCLLSVQTRSLYFGRKIILWGKKLSKRKNPLIWEEVSFRSEGLARECPDFSATTTHPPKFVNHSPGGGRGLFFEIYTSGFSVNLDILRIHENL